MLEGGGGEAKRKVADPFDCCQGGCSRRSAAPGGRPAALEVDALRGVLAGGDRRGVGRIGGGAVAHASQEVGAGGVQRDVGGQATLAGDRVEEREARRRPAGEANRDRPIDRDDRNRRAPLQLGVEGGDPRPVGAFERRGSRVEGGDGRLDLVWPDAPQAQGTVQLGDALVDGRGIPEGAILLGQPDRVPAASVRAGRRASVSSISASSPSASASSGTSSASRRARRIASAARSGRPSSGPPEAVWPSVKTT